MAPWSAPIPIVAMAGTLRLSPPLLRWTIAEEGGLPFGNGTSRAWPHSCVASLASGYAVSSVAAFFVIVGNLRSGLRKDKVM